MAVTTSWRCGSTPGTGGRANTSPRDSINAPEELRKVVDPEPSGVNPDGRCARTQDSTAFGWPGTRHQCVTVATSVSPIPTAGLSSDAISPVLTVPGGRGESALMRAASASARCRGEAACDVVLAVCGWPVARPATWLPQPASVIAAQTAASVSQ